MSWTADYAVREMRRCLRTGKAPSTADLERLCRDHEDLLREVDELWGCRDERDNLEQENRHLVQRIDDLEEQLLHQES